MCKQLLQFIEFITSFLQLIKMFPCKQVFVIPAHYIIRYQKDKIKTIEHALVIYLLKVYCLTSVEIIINQLY